jgi:hypothetical protein
LPVGFSRWLRCLKERGSRWWLMLWVIFFNRFVIFTIAAILVATLSACKFILIFETYTTCLFVFFFSIIGYNILLLVSLHLIFFVNPFTAIETKCIVFLCATATLTFVGAFTKLWINQVCRSC